jgi:hypothetical protein
MCFVGWNWEADWRDGKLEERKKNGENDYLNIK